MQIRLLKYIASVTASLHRFSVSGKLVECSGQYSSCLQIPDLFKVLFYILLV